MGKHVAEKSRHAPGEVTPMLGYKEKTNWCRYQKTVIDETC
jgi:hypothetical protein